MSRIISSHTRNSSITLLLVLALTSCGPSHSSRPQSPSAYLNGALTWTQSHSVFQRRIHWTAFRHQARAMTRTAKTTADTYPAIELAIKRLRDGFLLRPNQLAHPIDIGFRAVYPERLVVDVTPGSPADQAGLRIGDVIERINGSAPRTYADIPGLAAGKTVTYRLVVRHPGQPKATTLSYAVSPNSSQQQCVGMPRGRTFASGHAAIGYIDLPVDCNTLDYARAGQSLLRTADRAGACGWIVDLRHTEGGDIWTYLATLGPVLGAEKLGGFLYSDGKREAWEYRGGKVYWDGQERDESQIGGSVYRAKRATAPMAVLIGRDTNGAGELSAVALRGRPNTRSFGEQSAGFPTLTSYTPLSDGAGLLVSGAFSYDRTGRSYRGPIGPDMKVRTDWAQYGTERDPALRAALRWLTEHPACTAS